MGAVHLVEPVARWLGGETVSIPTLRAQIGSVSSPPRRMAITATSLASAIAGLARSLRALGYAGDCSQIARILHLVEGHDQRVVALEQRARLGIAILAHLRAHTLVVVRARQRRDLGDERLAASLAVMRSPWYSTTKLPAAILRVANTPLP